MNSQDPFCTILACVYQPAPSDLQAAWPPPLMYPLPLKSSHFQNLLRSTDSQLGLLFLCQPAVEGWNNALLPGEPSDIWLQKLPVKTNADQTIYSMSIILNHLCIIMSGFEWAFIGSQWCSWSKQAEKTCTVVILQQIPLKYLLCNCLE